MSEALAKLNGDPNIPGLSQVLYIDVRDVVSVPRPDADRIIQSDITLEAGAAWKALPCTQDTVGYTEGMERNTQGETTTQRITGSLPKATPLRVNELNRMKSGRYLVLGKDMDGQQRLLGTLKNPARFSWSHSTGNGQDDGNKFDITFSAQHRDSAPYYQADADVYQYLVIMVAYFADGENDISGETINIDDDMAAWYAEYSDENGNLGTVTFYKDDGSSASDPFVEISLPFALVNGDILKPHRSNTSGVGHIKVYGYQ